MPPLMEVLRGRGGPGQRQLYEATLREVGIPFVVKSATGIAEHPVTIGPMAEFMILVDSDDLDRARGVVAQLQAQEDELLKVTHKSDPFEPAMQEPLGMLSRVRRETGSRDRILLCLAGAVCLVASAYCLARFSDYGHFGILLLIMGLLFLAAARKI